MLLPLSQLCRGAGVPRQVLQVWPRQVCGGVRRCSEGGKKDVIPSQDQHKEEHQHVPVGKIGLTHHRINRLERYLLVWSGKYKSLAEVPDLVSQDALERARNVARIKINIMMCAATVLGCLVMIYFGKRARAAGESVVKMNQDWHKKVNEEYKAEIEKEKENE